MGGSWGHGLLVGLLACWLVSLLACWLVSLLACCVCLLLVLGRIVSYRSVAYIAVA